MEKDIIRVALDALEEYADAECLSEDEIRRAVHQILPSFKMTKDTSYGLYNSRGYQRNYFEVFSPVSLERYSVSFYEYSSFHDKGVI